MTTSSLMQGSTCLVTGASGSIGEEMAVGLAKLGAAVVIACRDAESSEAALLDVRRRSSGSNDIQLMLADLASLQAGRSLASDLLRRRGPPARRWPPQHQRARPAAVSCHAWPG
ncbi:MAG: SDR family NAD(P)-dependent oxidoreductase [Chloroflexi bacterium]|nr:SDR family NAD(P)-dependent oxidoreductase [Chloroflexota bacterium]